MKQVWMLFLYLTVTIKLAYSANHECVNKRKWQIGYTMYENDWNFGNLYVYARCNDSSHVLPYARNWNLCERGKLKKGLPRCEPENEVFFKCEVGKSWRDGFTQYKVIRSGSTLYVMAGCTKEEFTIDRDAAFIRCDNYISNRVLPQCRKGEVKNTFEACATGRISRSENYEFQNMWHNGALYVRVFCIHDGTQTRSDIILCENGKMKRTPAIDFCKIQENDGKACVLGKKWTANDTEYEISSIGRSLMVIGKCIEPGFHIAHSPRRLCELGRIPEVLPQCKGTKKLGSTNKCRVENGGCNQKCKYENGRVQCSCRKGYELQNDNKTCAEKRHEDACFSGKKWTANDTVYEISSYGNGFIIYIKCKEPSVFRITGESWKFCEQGRIPSELPQCKVVNLPPRTTSPVTNKCYLANGDCDHICNYINGTVQCSCNGGYQLHWDNKTCIVIDLPSTTISPESQAVHTTNGNISHTTDESIGSSVRNKCRVENGGCNQKCKYENGRVQCSCRKGYELQNDNKTCAEKRHEDACFSGKKWTANDTVYEISSYGNGFIIYIKCKEPSLFRITGESWKFCEQGRIPSELPQCKVVNLPPRTTSPVTNKCYLANGDCDHICNYINGTVQCSCNGGYELHWDNNTCIDINECLSQNFGCSDKCLNTPGSAFCSCPDGFTLLNDRKQCTDIDECSKNVTNKCHHQCLNTEGSYKCSCHPGYVLINDFKCEGCRKNSYRSSKDTFCVDCPLNSHTESNSKSSIADCLCNNGFYGNISNEEQCRDIDECASSNFGCSDSCVNTIGSAFCSCPPGFQLQNDQKTCSDIDECHVKNGGCQGICHNSNGSFRCTCEEGYTVSTTDSYACDDVNECLENNGGCSKECVNFLGGYQCSCPKESFLAEDKKTCLTLYCPEVPIPHHSRLSCFPEADKKAESLYSSNTTTYSEKLPVRTVCKVKCNLGYAINESSSAISCLKNGMWNDTLEECKVSQCPSLKPPENGDVHPPECKEKLMTVKEKCYFTCNEGFRIEGHATFTCKNNLTWKYDTIPTCEPIYITPYITCPSDVVLDLLPEQNSSVVFLKYPKTNVEDVQVTPNWVKFERNISFPAGKTDISLVASSPHFKNVTANCTFSVIVLDRQSPEFLDCPESIRAIGNNARGAIVDWETPTAFDNVGIKSMTQSAETNSTWFPGLHIVEYIAEDYAGNVATCSFEINVGGSFCEDLKDPGNGYANCQDWLYGKVCEPTCHDNYTRGSNEDEIYYFCDDNGAWSPSDVISPCFPECESEKIWSPELEICVDIIESTTDTLST
ncbi:hypothetical protein JTE90_010253 [Oedothorax gibbosus]|uniref:Uncharacterized protein n=1 Tax=Oedothorax gibbosus TaxID=931172 RepID=A0AAV6U5P0_9ARAC|nr:hypothetical protein JTE90_010253 [Oedothorax gibbosus]